MHVCVFAELRSHFELPHNPARQARRMEICEKFSRWRESFFCGAKRGGTASLRVCVPLSFRSCVALVYQMNFSANCICLELVEVDDIRPALEFVAPDAVKTCRATGAGGAKLA